MELKDKKVLLMGLGVLGGGLATAKWLLKKGVILTITDTKTEEQLKPSLEKLKKFETKIKYVLGEHKEKDFLENEIIVINPDVSVNNKFVQLAKKNGKQIENELTLFYKFCPAKNIIAVTGTRGKTTITNWIAHFLKSKYSKTILAGNSSSNPFLGVIDSCDENSIVVTEIPSYHLELLAEKNEKYEPKVALITNIYRDHLNRHNTLENYAKTKANIFKNQKASDFLILNKDNNWTEFLLSLKPKAKILYFSKEDSGESFVNKSDFIEKWGEHNFLNLKASILVATTMGVDLKTIKKAILTLPQIKFRQEKVYENKGLTIYNDTAATSPEATVAAVKRFNKDKKNLILITGGTNKELDFEDWAIEMKKNINMNNLVLLSGSATEKMKNFLDESQYNEFNNLSKCLKYALKLSKKEKSIILFSPSSKSFEKFKNEYDRGEQFNILVNQL